MYYLDSSSESYKKLSTANTHHLSTSVQNGSLVKPDSLLPMTGTDSLPSPVLFTIKFLKNAFAE